MSNGTVFIHRIEREQIIGHQYYIKNCLRSRVDEIKHQRFSYETGGIKIHYDNGKPNIHKDMFKYVEFEGLTVVPHSPNSSDLATCDLWLFDLIKETLTDQSDSESLYDAVTS
ncbi:unnamed protein product, partial [Rotaria sp. Silwood2]